MKTLIIALLTLTTNLLFAQSTATWIGGTPGKETKWDEPRNWDNNQVPEEDTYVIVKQLNSGHNAQPVINVQVEVVAIEIHSGAHLTIEKTGTLILNGEYIYSEGISFFGGDLTNKGNIHFYNLAIAVSSEYLNKIQNEGRLFVDNNLINVNMELIDTKKHFVKIN